MEPNQFETYRLLLRERLSDHRYTHSLGVMDAARALAERWGADAEIAETAGLLHDITKEMPISEQIAMMERHGVSVDVYETRFEPPFHSISAACFLCYELGITDETVLSAVRWHSTAKPNMNVYEKIIYIADFIEPNRHYHDVDFYRREAFSDLDRTCYLGLKWNLMNLLQKDRPIHRASLDAYHDFLQKRKD